MDVMEKQSTEKRLIDSKAFVEHLERMAHIARTTYPNLFHGLFEAAEYVKDFPAIDAVTVVRCRECKYWKPSGSKAGNSFSDMEYIGGCEFTNYCRRESDFCSYGKRKDSDGNG